MPKLCSTCLNPNVAALHFRSCHFDNAFIELELEEIAQTPGLCYCDVSLRCRQN